jgi:hypothetical protein
LKAHIAESRQLINQGGGTDFGSTMIIHFLEYYYSWGIRGDNTPAYAEYLGYLNSKDLYPDFKPATYEDFLKHLLAGEVRRVYDNKEEEKQSS